MRFALAALLAVVAGAGACGTDSGPSASESLTGRTFLAESVTGHELVAGTQVRLTFHDDGRLTASAGCNTLGGTPTVTADRIEIDGLRTTEMGCDPELHDQDEWLAGVLDSDPTYELGDGRLRLSADGAEIVLLDREVADPDRALEGTAWKLDGMIDGDAVSSVPAGVEGTLRFDDGKVFVEVCNQGSAEITVTGDEIEVGELESTLMACEDDRMAVERTVHDVLDGTISYEIEASVLTLLHPDGDGLLLRAMEG